MSKLSISALVLLLLTLTACGGSHIYIEEVAYDDYGYFGDEVAGRSYSATHIELGISSGNVYELDPQSLQIAFDTSATLVAGNKNCNAFQAESIWYDFGVAFDFTILENRICPIALIGFPEDVYLDDIFEIETYFELGRQVIVLYSEQQDVAIYLE
jgi:hypothetical protein